jgi:3',5'-cyclic AMP phosphodiesterase CpdA
MGTVRIAHVSDLHFGADQQQTTWKILRDHLVQQASRNLIHLVLVTGDIADTPSDKNLGSPSQPIAGSARAELDKIGIEYVVCPGNHDRYPWGNKWYDPRGHKWLSRVRRVVDFATQTNIASFSLAFQGKIATLQNPRELTLTDGSDEWKLRIIGVDSSIEASISAQGFLGDTECSRFESAMQKAEEIDLGILLIHHHLLPVRVLEPSKPAERLRQLELTRFTTLLNAGTVIEAVARANIDIALHGHEHAANWGQYGTLDSKAGRTVVIGAASATGTKTFYPCSRDRMSYNVINLNPDRSVDLFVLNYKEANAPERRWETAAHLQLLSPEDLRRQRFLRRSMSSSSLTPMPAAEIVRVMTFTREGDGIISQYQTDWKQDASNRWTLATRNSTGAPKIVDVRFIAPDDDEMYLKPAPAFQPASEANLWEASSVLNEEFFRRHIGQAFRLEESFKWVGGAIVTRSEMDRLRAAAARHLGPFRIDGKEFAAVSISRWFESMMLVVRLPPELAPNPDSLAVFVQHVSDPSRNLPVQPDIGNGLRLLGPGLYSLTIPYPRKDYRYGLSWKPFND